MASVKSPSTRGTPHYKHPFPRKWSITSLGLLLGAYLIYFIHAMGLNWERISNGLGFAGKLLGRMFPPNFSRWELLLNDLAESLEIAIISSVIGIFYHYSLACLPHET